MGTNIMTKYEQLFNWIINQIKSNHLQRGDKLPSIRHLAQQFSVSKDTVQRALKDLVRENYIYTVPKSGYYVLNSKNKESYQLPFTIEDFHNHAFDDFHRCINDTLSNREEFLFNYYHNSAGLDELLTALHHYFFEQNIYQRMEDIIITSGTQQALYILSQMSFPNQKTTILLEEPTYSRMIDLVINLNLPVMTIKREFGKLNLNHLENHFKNDNIKFFYTIPNLSNPLGLSYTSEEKQQIAKLASKYDVYIVEDDYLSDFARTDQLPLHYYDTSSHIIYLKSFSAILFPTLRIGATVLPHLLYPNFLKTKKLMDYDSNLIMQKALSLYLENGMFDSNKKHLQTTTYERQLIYEAWLKELRITDYRITPNFITFKQDSEVDFATLKTITKPLELKNAYLKSKKRQYLQIPLTSQLYEQLKKATPK